jgi:hypothetical protein
VRGTGTRKDRDEVNRLVVTSAGIPLRLKKKKVNSCVCDNEERKCGVGTDVSGMSDGTMLFETLQVVGITGSVRTEIRL